MGVKRAPKPITDTDIPAAIARDIETASAIADHVAAVDPHPSLWQRITNTFLRLTGGQEVLKNNPAVANDSFQSEKNHIELSTNDGSNPIIGFHRAGFSGTALYHSGYGDNSLRVRNADGFDGALIHDGNIASKTAGNANNLINLLSAWAAAATHWDGTYRWRHLGGWAADDNAILVHRAFVADRAATAAAADNVAPSIAAHVADSMLHGIRGQVVNSTLPALASNTTSIVLPAGITPDKIVGISAIAKYTSGSNFAYVRPDGGLIATGWKYTVHISNTNIVMAVGTAAESQLVFGLPVKILIQYLP